MRLEFTGIVQCGHRYRQADMGDLNGAIHIGEVDLVDEIAEEAWSNNVRVILNGEVLANGNVVTETGWGYSEYSPIDSDKIEIGECDLLERLEALEGQEVIVVIEDVE